MKKLWQILGIGCHFVRVYLHVRGHAKQVIPAGKDLGAAQGLFCAEVLAVEIALLEDVGIAQAKGAYAKAHQENGNVTAKGAAACDEHPAFEQASHFPGVEGTSVAVEPLRPDVVPTQKKYHGAFERAGVVLRHGRYSLAPDADYAVHSADGVIAQKGKEKGNLCSRCPLRAGCFVVVHGYSEGLQAVAGVGVGVSPISLQNSLWTCLQEKSS